MTTSIDTAIRLRSIDELLDERFVIPSYQRGYRWTKRQVRELLDDLREFERTEDSTKKQFYCLQPIVVRRRGDAWEVIDGQQRLTTIALFMAHQKAFMPLLGKQPFSLAYDTRPGSEGFLAAPDLTRRDENIDFWHMAGAWEAMNAWIKTHHDRRDGAAGFNVLKSLTGPETPNVQVIWYELPPEEDAIAAFIRLNVGKIPLTSAELIRALFLRARNFDARTKASGVQIAHEWDAIEKRLQAAPFWGFVHKTAKSPYSARIEYLFEIKLQALAREGRAAPPSDDAYGTFIAWQSYFDPDDSPSEAGADSPQRRTVDQHWDDLKFLELRLTEWFGDRALYHLVGTCIAVATDPSATVIVDLIEQRERLTRTAFERYLKGRIFLALFKKTLDDVADVSAHISKALRALSYPDNAGRIRVALLLFNVATLMRNTGSNLRFDFDRFKREDWDLEHIRSVTAYKPTRFDHVRAWLEKIAEYWAAVPPEDVSLMTRTRKFLAADTIDLARFDGLYTRIRAAFGEGDGSDVDDSLANLTLLDSSTNRGYQNAPFPVKRRTILDLDKKGTFAPLCTTNVFLKYYSTQAHGPLFWARADADDYLTAIIDTISHFFAEDPACV